MLFFYGGGVVGGWGVGDCAASETAVISFVILIFTQKRYEDVQRELFQHHIKFHSTQLNNV